MMIIIRIQSGETMSSGIIILNQISLARSSGYVSVVENDSLSIKMLSI